MAGERNRRQSKPRTPPDVVREIARLTLVESLGPKAIEGLLEADARYAGRVPSRRTIVNLRRRYLEQDDDGEPWSVLGSEPGEAALLLPIIRTLMRTPFRRRPLSRQLASAILAIRDAAPDLAPWSAYNLAVFALTGSSGPDVDAYLAFAPWRGERELARYVELYQGGAVGEFLNPNYEDPDELYRAAMAAREEEVHDGEQR